MDPCAEIVRSTAWVVEQAKSVSICTQALDSFVDELDGLVTKSPETAWNLWHFGDDASSGGPLTAQYVLVLDALNWCFWPSTTNMEYDTLASGLTAALRANAAAFDASALQAMTPETLRSWFLPHDLPYAAERAQKLREVGSVLAAAFGGSARALIAAAGGSAVSLVRLVAAHFPGFRDEAVYEANQIFFYKRAQIFVGDVWNAVHGCLTDAASAPLSCAPLPSLTLVR